MIESLRVRNFQCHSDLLIELDPHVTTIVGPSDCGKSAVVRALRWAAMNVPVGCLIKDGEKQASVELIVDGHKIIRSRGSENTYALDDKEYRAFRSDVPEDIAALLNVSEINFQGQHDPLYWFSSSAGEVSRQLNAVVDLAVIDRTLAEAARQVNRNKAILENAEENLAKSVSERNELKWVVEADVDLKLVEKRADEQDRLREWLEEFSALVGAANSAEKSLAELTAVAADSDRLLEKMAAAGKASKAALELSGLLDDAKTAAKKASAEIPDIEKLGAAAEKAERAATEARNFVLLLKESELANDNRIDLARQLAGAEEELKTKTEGRCPLCGAEMK